MTALRLSQWVELGWFEGSLAINHVVIDGFDRLKVSESTRRSHFFDGRYENIYPKRQLLPELEPILVQAVEMAKVILKRESLKMGFWFNEMPAGSKTRLHSHDDDDELLSAVYYLKVPQNSGRLHLLNGPVSTYVEPEEGMYVFFDPSIGHEVEENRSGEIRLSLAMNFGPVGA